ncbi:hypothetical protein AB0L13_46170 [Saccharopolyspora shandongensis]|uniref:hypothetical protein n=1 Tax=Saccharopolyspora shandongensis TaxID=418495 RepID=UPI003413C496
MEILVGSGTLQISRCSTGKGRTHRAHRLPGLNNTGVISSPAWIPTGTRPLDEITLTLDSMTGEATISGDEPASAAVRPLATIDTRYRRYHDAIRDLAAPRLFEKGSVPARTLPFEENTLTWLSESRKLSPGAAAALHLAWTHRKVLLC